MCNLCESDLYELSYEARRIVESLLNRILKLEAK